MSRFYVRPESVQNSKICISKEESHHIIDVMRLGRGDAVIVFDGTGKLYEGRIASTDHKEVVIDVEQVRTYKAKSNARISLAQAIPKKEKMEFIVQKATELGIEEIIPFTSMRTVVKVRGDRNKHKQERWHKIAIEASKQCGRNTLPKISDVVGFEEVMGRVRQYNRAIMPCLSQKSSSLRSVLQKSGALKNVLVIIGPEGGFDEEEARRAVEYGVTLVSLGDLVLKSDTAAIATAAILHYHMNLR